MKFFNAIRKFFADAINLVVLSVAAVLCIPLLVLLIIADWINPTKKDEKLSNEEFQKRMNTLTANLQKVMK